MFLLRTQGRRLIVFGKKAKLTVTGMSCGHCEQAVEKNLSEMESVTKVKADHSNSVVTLHYKGEQPGLEEVILRVKNAGYEPGKTWL
jgi:copper chaperone